MYALSIALDFPLARVVLIDQQVTAVSETHMQSGITLAQARTSELTRYVWDGDQLLFEIRTDGGNVSSQVLENDRPAGVEHGSVLYTHGPTLDRPLDIIRMGLYATAWGDAYPVHPIADFRGGFVDGADADGARLPCGSGPCLIVWPKFSAFYTQQATQTHFFGSLVTGKEDASGFTYMRNRYYNPQTGAFTQSDPIGLAGGLNTYGFAEGDPVTYSDPYGLSAEANCCPKWLVDAAAGFGDAVSFGLSGAIRRNTPGGDGVDYGSGAYAGGTVAGVAFTTAGGVGIAATAGRGAAVVSGTRSAAGTRAAGTAARASRYDDVTASGSRIINRATDVTRGEFEANLIRAGFRQSVSRDGAVNVFTRDGVQYTTRASSRSTGAPTAEYFPAGSNTATLKIRLQPQRIWNFSLHVLSTCDSGSNSSASS